MCASEDSAIKMFHEISRVLRPGGYYILISGADESRRVPFLENSTFKWKLKHFTIETNQPPDVDHIYVMKQPNVL